MATSWKAVMGTIYLLSIDGSLRTLAWHFGKSWPPMEASVILLLYHVLLDIGNWPQDPSMNTGSGKHDMALP